MSYTNADGVYVLTGLDRGALRPAGVATKEARKTLVYDIDLTRVPATVDGSTINPMDPTIPANSIIVSCTYFAVTGATSGGAATLDVGTYLANGTAVSATGLMNGTALTAIDAAGEVVKSNAPLALVTGTTSTGSAPVYVQAKYNVAAYTAGTGKLVITYIQTGV